MAVFGMKRNAVLAEGTEDDHAWEHANAIALYSGKAQMARTVIITGRRDKPLKFIQSAQSLQEIWENFRTRYKVASTTNKINVLTWRMNTP